MNIGDNATLRTSLPDQEDREFRWMDTATSALILAGIAGFIGLVASVFYLSLEDLAEEYLHAWFMAFWYTVSAAAFLSVGLAALRFRQRTAHRAHSVHGSLRRGWTNTAADGVIVLGIAALFAISGALTYMVVLDTVDSGWTDINPLWYTAFWYVPAGVGAAALIAALACMRYRLFLTLTWLIVGGFFVLIMLASLLNQTQSGAGAFFDPFSIPALALCVLVVAGLIRYLRKALEPRPRTMRQRVAFVITLCSAAVLTLFTIGTWVYGRQPPTSATVVQPAPRPVTWEAVRDIIAEKLHTSKEQVTPDTRLREDLHAKPNDIQQVLLGFEEQYRIVTQPNDDEIIFTAQDAFAFAQDPEGFRDRAWQSR
jgi:acyl carrier protein